MLDPRTRHRRNAWRAAGLVLGIWLVACTGESSSRSEETPKQAVAHPPGHLPEALTTSVNTIASNVVFGDELLWRGEALTRPHTVAISGLADDPRYSVVAGAWPGEVPRLGRNPEELLALAPDLVLLADFTNTEYRAAITPHLAQLEFDAFTGFDTYRTGVQRLADRLGKPALAERLLGEFDREHAEIAAQRAAVAGDDPSRWPSCLVWQFDSTAGSESTFHDATMLAGCRNRAAEGGVSGHRRVDVEQMMAWNPDYVIISCGEVECASAAAQFRQRAGVRNLPAIEQGHIVAIPSPYLSTTGIGMLELARRIQAGVFGLSASSPPQLSTRPAPDGAPGSSHGP